MSENINVGGRLHSIATGNVLAGSNEILDDALGKKQSQVNVETYALVENVNNALASLSPEQQGALDVSEKANNNEVKLGYYVCQTEGNVAAKTIAAANYILGSGGSIKIKMNNANTADNATLNINSTGAKALYYAGERASSINSWEAGETVEVYYDGTSFYANNVAGSSSSGDGAFDISAKTGDTYETLSAALTAANSILSASKKKGGMSIKFIQLTPATYTVVKTEGVTEQPTGTEVQEALSLENGTYTAAQMTGVTPPESGSVTYYLAVTETVDEQEVTTYTTWVIIKATSDVQKYVQYRYMETVTTAAIFTNVTNWQGVDEGPTAGSKNLTESGGTFDMINEPYFTNVELNLSWVNGKLYNITNGNIDSFSGYNVAYARFVPTNLNYIIATGNQGNSNKYAFLIFFDSSDNILFSLSQRSTTFVNEKVAVPKDTSYVIVNISNTTVDYGLVGVGIGTLQEKVEEFSKPVAQQEFNSLSIEDTTDSEDQATEMSLSLKKNNGTQQQPDVVTLDTITIPQATENKAGLLPAKGEWDEKPTLRSGKTVSSNGIFYGINEPYFNNKTVSLINGRGYNISTGELVVSPTASYAKITVIDFEYIVATGRQPNHHNYPLIAFFNANDEVISVLDTYDGTTASTVTGKIVTVPADTSYVVINIINTIDYNFVCKSISSLQEKVVEYATPIVKELSDRFLQEEELSLQFIQGAVYNINTGEIVTGSGVAYAKTYIGKEEYIIVNAKQPGSSRYAVLAFFDDSDNLISYLSQASTTFTNEKVTVPANASYFICNVDTNVDYSFSAEISTIDELKELPSSFVNYTLLEYTNLVTGELINVNNGEIVTGDNCAHCDFNVEGLSEIYVTGAQHSSNNFPIVTFYDSSDNKISSFGVKSTNYVKQVVVVPPNSVRALMNLNSTYAFGCYVREISTIIKKPVFYDIKDDVIKVTTKYTDSKDFRITFGKKTVNQFFDFGNFNVIDNNEDYPADVYTIGKTFGSGTDFLGAIGIAAINNIDGDKPNSHDFTGGAHAYNNNYVDGTPTQRTTNIKFYIDGRIVTEGKGYCSKIRITWTNYVQGYNTKKADGSGREILQENYELLFDGIRWNVYCELIALEEVVIEAYSGMDYQSYSGDGIYPKVRFPGSVNRGEYVISRDHPNSGDNTCSMIKGYGDEHEIILTLDTSFDLGKREFMQWEGHAANTNSTNKVYFYLVTGESGLSGGNCPLNAGDMRAFKGSYQFIPAYNL